MMGSPIVSRCPQALGVFPPTTYEPAFGGPNGGIVVNNEGDGWATVIGHRTSAVIILKPLTYQHVVPTVVRKRSRLPRLPMLSKWQHNARSQYRGKGLDFITGGIPRGISGYDLASIVAAITTASAMNNERRGIQRAVLKMICSAAVR